MLTPLCSVFEQRFTRIPEPDRDVGVIRNLFGAHLAALQEESTGDAVQIRRGRDVDGSSRCAFRECKQRWNPL